MIIEQNPGFNRRMENAVDFSSEGGSEGKISFGTIVIYAVVIAAGTYCVYRLLEPRKIVINHYYLPKPKFRQESQHYYQRDNLA
jgi:hypothetical protein